MTHARGWRAQCRGSDVDRLVSSLFAREGRALRDISALRGRPAPPKGDLTHG
jgi:hypothetical protein